MGNNEQLPRGRQIFGITTPLPPPVRDKDLAPPPTPEEKRAANAGKFAGSTRTVERIGGGKALKVALGTGIAVAGTAVAYQTIPAFHQSVNTLGIDIAGRWNSLFTPEASPTFDSKAKEQTIKVGINTEFVDINQLSSSKEHTESSMQIVLPLKLGDNQQINYATRERDVTVGTMKGNDPDTFVKTGVEHQFQGYGFVIPTTGTEFIVPPDIQNGKVLRYDHPLVVNGENRYSELSLEWEEKDGNLYTLGFNWNDNVTQVDFTDISKDAPFWKPVDRSTGKGATGKPADGGKSVLKTAVNNARVNVYLLVMHPDRSGGYIPFEFKTTTNNGVQKIILSK